MGFLEFFDVQRVDSKLLEVGFIELLYCAVVVEEYVGVDGYFLQFVGLDDAEGDVGLCEPHAGLDEGLLMQVQQQVVFAIDHLEELLVVFEVEAGEVVDDLILSKLFLLDDSDAVQDLLVEFGDDSLPS